MREILFRGKRTDNGEWIEGFYYQKTNPLSQDGLPIFHGISDLPPFGAEVDPATVGQYTGLTDKKGKKGKMIFEGDVLSHFINYQGRRIKGVVAYDMTVAAYMWEPKGLSSLFLVDVLDGNGAEIIGNIHDNPDLLKGGE